MMKYNTGVDRTSWEENQEPVEVTKHMTEDTTGDATVQIGKYLLNDKKKEKRDCEEWNDGKVNREKNQEHLIRRK